MPVIVNIRYDGLQAADHRLEMRQFGRSLIGMERCISNGLYTAIEGRPPTARRRLEIATYVSAPTPACLDINAILEPAVGILPFVYQEIEKIGPKLIWQWLTYLFKLHGGKPKQAEPHFMELLNLTREIHEGRLAAEVRAADQVDRLLAHAERTQERTAESLLEMAQTLRRPVAETLAPVGPSCETLRIKASDRGWSDTTEVDVPMAEAARSGEPLEVGEMTQFKVFVDGLTLHNHRLSVEMEQRPGVFIPAEVRDPAFDSEKSVYRESIGSTLVVQAKPTMRDGEIVKLHIMDAHSG